MSTYFVNELFNYGFRFLFAVENDFERPAILFKLWFHQTIFFIMAVYLSSVFGHFEGF